MKTLGQYRDLYVKAEVFLLAGVFQNFQKLCMQYYKIDCAYFCVFTSLGLARQAAIKKSKTRLKL